MQIKYKRKTPIKTYLLILILLAYGVTGMSFAKYMTVVSGDGSITVAKYIIDLDVTKDSVPFSLEMSDMKPGDTAIYDIVVSNHKDLQRSELALYFKIEIATDAVLPLEIELEENWEDGITYGLDGLTGKIESGIYELNITASKELNFILIIVWPSESNDESYQSLTNNLTLRVIWEQVI